MTFDFDERHLLDACHPRYDSYKHNVNNTHPTPSEAEEYYRLLFGLIRHKKNCPRWKEKIENIKRKNELYHMDWHDIVFCDKGKYGVRSIYGDIILPAMFDAVGEIHDDSLLKIFYPIPVVKDSRYYLAGKGGVLLAGPFDKIERVGYKYYVVCIGDKWGMLDYKCKQLIDIKYEALYYDWYHPFTLLGIPIFVKDGLSFKNTNVFIEIVR